ncbi:uncharacterized protein LOC131051930 isoform X2 [Cryptomeria japonica]|uniref:uncharacterized protein LOC131051930 isoform X2 n=1 Tax=Cryptomeria japonica TaxID=3369 RepID=UPI0025AD16BF|nr:uncharacterized protein LOC131051930 isoform X2 [Cryptomeria japonica]
MFVPSNSDSFLIKLINMHVLQVSNTPVTLILKSSSTLLGNPIVNWNGYGSTVNTANSKITKQHNIKQRRRRNGVILAGFAFEKRARYPIEKAANQLMKEASSLLVYQDILKKPVAKAFLDVVNGIRSRETAETLLRLYGVFFKLMALGCFSSWQDFVLDSILEGGGSPFAIAAANVGNPQSVWSSGIPESLRLAAASDLGCLQALTITESTLARWVVDLVSEQTDIKLPWKVSSIPDLDVCSEEETYSLSPEISFKDFDDAPEMSTLSTLGASVVQKERLAKTFKKNDIMEIDREIWRKKIGDLVRWSEAVPLLVDYYATHSYGILASVTAFRWKTEKLVCDKFFYSQHKSICNFSHQRTHLESLQKNFRNHASRSPAQHVLLKGELRIVSFPSNELKALHKLLEDLAQHWQLRFVVVIDDFILKGGDGHIKLLKSALDGRCQDFPSNIIICGTSTHCLQAEDVHTSFSNLRSSFRMIIQMKSLSLEQYLVCVEELLNLKMRLFPSIKVNIDDLFNRAKQWVESENLYTVQDASQFVNNFFHSY